MCEADLTAGFAGQQGAQLWPDPGKADETAAGGGSQGKDPERDGRNHQLPEPVAGTEPELKFQNGVTGRR